MFKNSKIATRLIGSFLILIILSAIVAGIGIFNMSKINDKADAMYANELLGLSYIEEANVSLISLGRARGNYLLATTEEERTKQIQMRQKYAAELKANLEKAQPLFVTEKAKQIFANFATTWGTYEKSMDKAYALAASEKLQQRSDELNQVLEETRKHADVLDNHLDELRKQKEARAKAASEETTALYESSRNLMILLVISSILAGMTLGILISRSVTRPLNEAVKVAQTVAAGDLTSDIKVDSTNELGQLLQALKEMNESLVGIVSEVRTGTDTIATASNQIATGNLDLSSRTEQQASSLEETASSMEELTSTVKQNGDNARQANQLAVSASDVAVKGGEVVAQVVDTMGSINDSSKKIVDIIGVIDGIAFQTNILALNAAVEAARAGEQGRGFAVVASEVRNLAQRSASAAKEIKELISDSVEKVEAGSKLVNQAGTTMDEIVASVRRVTDIMGEITAAGREQEAGIEQINQAITEMDNVTQQNAALVEEAAAAAQSLQDQAGNLSQVVSVFKTSGTQPASARVIDITPRASAPAATRIAAVPTKQIASRKTATDQEWAEF
jgi:methyl-accepting chemotaxis protein